MLEGRGNGNLDGTQMTHLLMRYVRCLDKLDMTDNIIKICVNLSHQCHLCAIKHNAKLSFNVPPHII